MQPAYHQYISETIQIAHQKHQPVTASPSEPGLLEHMLMSDLLCNQLGDTEEAVMTPLLAQQ